MIEFKENKISKQWIDTNLKWEDGSKFKLIDYLVLPDTLVWKPEISIISHFSNMTSFVLSEGQRVMLEPDGRVNWFPTGRVYTKCLPNLRMFPFDVQVCDIRLQCWNFPTSQIKLKPANEKEEYGQVAAFKPVLNRWTENSQWRIIKNETLYGRQLSPSGHCYTFVTLRIILQRKPMFQVINIILPSLIVSGAEMVTFYLPFTDPTAVQISVTCLLAYTVFQALLMQNIPREIDTTPLVSLYIDLQMFYIGFIATLGTSMIMALSNFEFSTKNASTNPFINVIQRIGRTIGMNWKPRHVIPIETVAQSHDNRSIVWELLLLKATFTKWKSRTENLKLKKQILFICKILQRLLFWIYFLLSLVTPIFLALISLAIGHELHFEDTTTNC